MTSSTVDEARATKVFTALADPTRRTVIETLAALELASATALARELTITRQAVLKHLTVLADADLVESSRRGREVLFEVRPAALRETATWLTARADRWSDQLAALKVEAERRALRGQANPVD